MISKAYIRSCLMVALLISASSSFGESSSIKSVPNYTTDHYKHTQPSSPPPPQSSDNCAGKSFVRVENGTEYVLYYDFHPVSGTGIKWVDHRIEPHKAWKHCPENGDYFLDIDYDLSTPGIQMKSFRLMDGVRYQIFEESSLKLSIRKN